MKMDQQALNLIRKDKAISSETRAMAEYLWIGCPENDAVSIHSELFGLPEKDSQTWLLTTKSMMLLVGDKLNEARIEAEKMNIEIGANCE